MLLLFLGFPERDFGGVREKISRESGSVYIRRHAKESILHLVVSEKSIWGERKDAA
jgi:hypothetical protein